MIRFSLCASVLIVALCVATPSLAAEKDSPVAASLFDAGRDLFIRKDFVAACPKLAESARLDPKVGSLALLGFCEEKIGRLVSARRRFAEALEIARIERDARISTIESELARLETIIPKLSVTAPLDPPVNLVVRIDDPRAVPAAVGVPIPVDPGMHTVMVNAPGRKEWTSQVHAKADGATTFVAIPTLERDESALPPAPTAPIARDERAALPRPIAATSNDGASAERHAPSSPSTVRTLGMVAAGAGVVGLGASGVFALRANAKNDDSNAGGKCIDDRCNAAGSSLRDEAQSAGRIATVLVVAGGVLTVGGVALWFLAPKVQITKTTAIAVAPSFAMAARGVSLGGTW